jgi:hypothetical protein
MKPIKANYPIAILPIMTAITFRPGCVCLFETYILARLPVTLLLVGLAVSGHPSLPISLAS